MFLCVSPNPAIDKRLIVPSLSRGKVNRARTIQGYPGGKSAHVAMVLHTLGGNPAGSVHVAVRAAANCWPGFPLSAFRRLRAQRISQRAQIWKSSKTMAP